MKRLFLFSMILCACLYASAQSRQLFDEGWQFTREGKTINVNLPHDWDIYDAPNPETGATGTGGGWFQGGKGEYHKKFRVESSELRVQS